MNTITIGMPLIKDLSCNHYKGRRRDGGEFVKKPIKDWQETLGWLLKPYHLEDWNLPLTVRCDVVQDDKRVRDVHNYFKVVCDAIEELLGINDTNYKTEAGVPTFGEHAELVITIKE